MKKLFTLFLALAASVGTMFAEKVQIGDLYYNLNATDQTAEVTGDYWGLTTANIPASVTYSGTTYSVTSIGWYAFANCRSLTSVTIPNSVTSIGSCAFYNCSGLTSVTIPSSVTSIGSSAFAGCSGLTSLTVEAGNTVYDSRNNCNAIIETSTNTLIFGCQNTTIPNSVTSIGEGAFVGCSGLTSVTIGNSVTSIGGYAFSGCSGLTSVTIPNSVTNIGESAFLYCTSLTSVTIPNSVTSIGSSAFFYCSSLTSVTIGNSVTSIGGWAFAGCSGLTSVTCEAVNPPALGDAVFNGVDKSIPVYVPTASVNAYQSHPLWGQMNIIGLDEDISAVDNTTLSTTALKTVINGELFLTLPDGSIYNAAGVRVR